MNRQSGYPLGEGRAVYVGTYLTEQILSPLFDGLLTQTDVHPLIPELPSGIEVSMRAKTGRRLLFVLNTTEL